MRTRLDLKKSILPLLAAYLSSASVSFAADPAPAPSPGGDQQLEKVNVDAIKEKYWARGESSELGVVQNRLYSKEKKFEFGLLTGFTNSDPFLAIQTVGGHLGFHLSEYFGLQLIAWKDFVGPSSALTAFRNYTGGDTNYNAPHWYLGAEASASIIYGKLSLVGKSIIYYDLYFLGGVGATQTDSGTYITPELGLGQRFFLNKLLSLRLDYRLMYYHEAILERVVPQQLGQLRGYRSNFNHNITIGIDFLLGGQKKQ